MSLGEVNQTESRGVFLLKQSANIYTAMLILAFVFIVIGCLFLFLEMKSYNLSVKVPGDAKVPAAMWMPGAENSKFALNGFSRATDCQEVSIL
jgi:hypothetical protein